ncbi:MAG TPA: glycosyltransferase family 4 protein [Actinomycetota bacterium]|nr:glycosyltransferase family 4 protein [Actinomycetota bacterium]
MRRPAPTMPAGQAGPPPPVVVVHPIHQHAYETAAAADRAGLLRWFITGMYDTGRGAGNPDSWGWLPRPVGRAVRGRLRARWHPEIDRGRVQTIVRYHALAAGARIGLAWLPPAGPHILSEWATRRFDSAVARRLRRADHRGLVHAFEGGCIRTLEAAKRQGIPTVLDVPSAHEYYLDTIEAEGGTVDRRMTATVRTERALADYLLAPSDYVVRCLVEHGVERSKIVKIPYGVDTSRFLPRQAAEQDGHFRVLFVGSIGFRKGVHYLLEAWNRLRLPDASLILAGPADAEGLRILRRHGGLRHWVGPVPRSEVQRWFGAADLFVFPTLAEGFGLVYLEAMAAGLPVVTTPNSACVVRHGIDGLVVPPRDVDALCDALSLLHGQPDLRREMGASGRRLIETSYTWQHYRDALTSMYRAILGRQLIGALD